LRGTPGIAAILAEGIAGVAKTTKSARAAWSTKAAARAAQAEIISRLRHHSLTQTSIDGES
jgi:hypothetical protein